MSVQLLPISTLYIGLNGLIAFGLSFMVAAERTAQRVWHGESRADVIEQPDYLKHPNPWAAFVERWTTRTITQDGSTPGLLQRKVRAHANFAEYVPHGLLFVLALEAMGAPNGLVWLLGGSLTVARIAHAFGLIATYGPSPGRAVGFFLTWAVYLLGSFACLWFALKTLIAP